LWFDITIMGFDPFTTAAAGQRNHVFKICHRDLVSSAKEFYRLSSRANLSLHQAAFPAFDELKRTAILAKDAEGRDGNVALGAASIAGIVTGSTPLLDHYDHPGSDTLSPLEAVEKRK
jgi:hypothetical protein